MVREFGQAIATPRLNSNSGCAGACRFELDVAEEAL